MSEDDLPPEASPITLDNVAFRLDHIRKRLAELSLVDVNKFHSIRAEINGLRYEIETVVSKQENRVSQPMDNKYGVILE